jgi:hypothetical protein
MLDFILEAVHDVGSRWERQLNDDEVAAPPGDGPEERLHAQMLRHGRLVEAQRGFAAIGGKAGLRKTLEEAATLIRHQQMRTACVNLAATLAITIITGGIASAAGEAVGGAIAGTAVGEAATGAEVAEGVATARTGVQVARSAAGTVANIATNAGVNTASAVLMSAPDGATRGESADVGREFLEMVAMDVLTRGLTRAFAGPLSHWQQVEQRVIGASPGQRRAAIAQAITLHALIGSTSQVVAHLIATGGDTSTFTSAALTEQLLMTGAGIALGKYFHTRIKAWLGGRGPSLARNRALAETPAYRALIAERQQFLVEAIAAAEAATATGEHLLARDIELTQREAELLEKYPEPPHEGAGHGAAAHEIGGRHDTQAAEPVHERASSTQAPAAAAPHSSARLANLRQRLPPELAGLPLRENPDLAPGSMRVVYDDGFRLEVARVATAEAVEAVLLRAHVNTARALVRFQGPLGKVRKLIAHIKAFFGRGPAPHSAGHDATLEVTKLQEILEGLERLHAEAQRRIESAQAAKLDPEAIAALITHTEKQVAHYTRELGSTAAGKGYIASEGLRPGEPDSVLPEAPGTPGTPGTPGNHATPIAKRQGHGASDDTATTKESTPGSKVQAHTNEPARATEPARTTEMASSIPTFRVARKDLVITTHKTSKEWTFTIEAPLPNGRNQLVAYGTAPLDEYGNVEGGPEFYFEKRVRVDGAEGKVQIHEGESQVSLTDVALDEATARYRADFGHEPSTLPGHLAFENKANFQRAYLLAVRQGMRPEEAKQVAIRGISFGRSRIARGYDDLHVDLTGEESVDLGPPLGIVQAPKGIDVEARRSKR